MKKRLANVSSISKTMVIERGNINVVKEFKVK